MGEFTLTDDRAFHECNHALSLTFHHVILACLHPPAAIVRPNAACVRPTAAFVCPPAVSLHPTASCICHCLQLLHLLHELFLEFLDGQHSTDAVTFIGCRCVDQKSVDLVEECGTTAGDDGGITNGKSGGAVVIAVVVVVINGGGGKVGKGDGIISGGVETNGDIVALTDRRLNDAIGGAGHAVDLFGSMTIVSNKQLIYIFKYVSFIIPPLSK
ncbi:hypothetical protein I4U23_018171 [Adineta vaga]|nr:hypothetical protein I4U23_018171 [Adineta vaga]